MSAELRAELLKENQEYDKTVDIVSCWEAAMKYSYQGQFDNFKFDRFPTLPANGNKYTPDFAVYFNKKYGIIGEIKRTFPEAKEAIFSELDQLQNYDGTLPLKTADGTYIEPECCDTVVIIEGSAAPQIGTRLQRIIVENEEVGFEYPPVLLRYQFNQDPQWSRYEFQRVTQFEFEFRDDELGDESLSSEIGKEGDYGTLPVYPKHFSPFKAKKPLCNDTPPGQYIATVLWHRVFPEYLTAAQYEQWQATNGSKEITLDVTVDGLTEDLNAYMHSGQANRRWIRRALNFLEAADLAEADDEGYSINYMGIVKDTSDFTEQEGTDDLGHTKELAHRLIHRYCTNVGDTGERPEEKDESAEEDSVSHEQVDFGQFT